MNLALRLLRLSGFAVFVALWALAARSSTTGLIPGPLVVARALRHLAQSGALWRHVVASLFRVSWGFTLAVLLGVPAGLCLGWYRRGERALNPILQVLRPISPLAWIPIAILWFGLGDLAAIFIIFLACFLPLTVATTAAVQGVPAVHVQAGRNFGLGGAGLLLRVLLPAAAPRILLALRLALGVAWLVVVAAEMIAVSSGLGFLVIDARNAGNRYDLVIGGMVLIGMVGVALDGLLRQVYRLRALSFVGP